MFFPRGYCLGKYTELWVSGLILTGATVFSEAEFRIRDLTDTDGECIDDQCRLDV